MVLVLEQKPLTGTWWKWALGLTVAQNVFWWIIGWTVNPSFGLLHAYATGWFVWGGWIVFSWLAIIAGRLGARTLMWTGLIGFLLGDVAYATLAFYEPIRRLYSLLPFTAFVQLNLIFLALGVVIEFGRFVYRKVFEE